MIVNTPTVPQLKLVCFATVRHITMLSILHLQANTITHQQNLLPFSRLLAATW